MCVDVQVEGLCAMVSGVEDLVATAERECGRMQARLSPVASHLVFMH